MQAFIKHCFGFKIISKLSLRSEHVCSHLWDMVVPPQNCSPPASQTSPSGRSLPRKPPALQSRGAGWRRPQPPRLLGCGHAESLFLPWNLWVGGPVPLEMNVPWLWVSLLAQGPQAAGADLLGAQWEGHVADGNGQTPASTDILQQVCGRWAWSS